MKTFFLNLRSELLKTKRSSAIWLAFIAGIFVPTILLIVCLSLRDALLRLYSKDPWAVYIIGNMRNVVPFLLPVYVILLCSLIAQIEHRNGTLKQVFASPRSYFDIYFSKFVVILILIIFSLVVFDLGSIGGAYMIGIIDKRFKFFEYPLPLLMITKITIKVFISVLAIAAIQYWMAFRFKNFIAAFGIGFGGIIGSLVIHSWEKAHYIPYLYPSEMFFNQMTGLTGKVHATLLLSLAVFAVVMTLGLIDTVYKREKA